jgi:hypothetical protein
MEGVKEQSPMVPDETNEINIEADSSSLPLPDELPLTKTAILLSDTSTNDVKEINLDDYLEMEDFKNDMADTSTENHLLEAPEGQTVGDNDPGDDAIQTTASTQRMLNIPKSTNISKCSLPQFLSDHNFPPPHLLQMLDKILMNSQQQH